MVVLVPGWDEVEKGGEESARDEEVVVCVSEMVQSGAWLVVELQHRQMLSPWFGVLNAPVRRPQQALLCGDRMVWRILSTGQITMTSSSTSSIRVISWQIFCRVLARTKSLLAPVSSLQCRLVQWGTVPWYISPQYRQFQGKSAQCSGLLAR